MPVGANCNLFYLRGQHLRLHELADPDKVPYNLAWSERGLGPTNLQIQAMNNIYPGMADLSLCQLMKLKVFGRPLWKYGFWNLMFRVLSNEGYQFMKDSGGYDANVANANAVTQLPATEYGDDTEFLTLCEGYQHLPLTLAEQFDEEKGGKLAAGRAHPHEPLPDRDRRRRRANIATSLHFRPTVTTDAQDLGRRERPSRSPCARSGSSSRCRAARSSWSNATCSTAIRPISARSQLGAHPERVQAVPRL